MIVVRRKDLDEIASMVADHDRVLVAGCNTCAAVALAGGEKEVETLAAALRVKDKREGASHTYVTDVIKRQCEPEYVEELEIDDVDAVLSLGCGAGVALLAELLGKPVYPALDTLFIGAAQGVGEWRAECSACGKCVLGATAGICPLTRCAKGILVGPCGGVNEGKCEVDPERDCAWVLIHERLEDLDRIEDFEEILPPKDHSPRTKEWAWKALDEGGPE